MKKSNKTKSIIQNLCGALILCIGICISCLSIKSFSHSQMLFLSKSPMLAIDIGLIFQNIWQFIKTNWLWFAIGGGVLLCLIILIVCICVAKHKKKTRRLKEENLSLTMDLSKGLENQESTEETVEETKQQEETQDNLTIEPVVHQDVPEQENLSTQPAYPHSTNQSFPDIMEYIKMKMQMDKQKSNFNNAANIMPQKIDVVVEKDNNDDRVRQIKKEYQEELQKIDEILHEQEKAKLREEMQQEQEIIDKLQEEYEIADNLLDELYNKDNNENSIAVSQPIQEQKNEDNVEDNVEFTLEEKKENINIHEDSQLEGKQVVSSGDIVITPNKKLTLQESYKLLSSQQKEYFRNLRDYADKKPNSRSKESKNYVVVGCGNKHYIRLSIKRGLTIASFASENEEMMRLRLSGLVPIKAEELQIKIVDDNAFLMAKQMIDIRVNQVAREKQIIKEIRKENNLKSKNKK